MRDFERMLREPPGPPPAGLVDRVMERVLDEPRETPIQEWLRLAAAGAAAAAVIGAVAWFGGPDASADVDVVSRTLIDAHAYMQETIRGALP